MGCEAVQIETGASSGHWQGPESIWAEGRGEWLSENSMLSPYNDNAFYSPLKHTAKVVVLCRSGKAPLELSSLLHSFVTSGLHLQANSFSLEPVLSDSHQPEKQKGDGSQMDHRFSLPDHFINRQRDPSDSYFSPLGDTRPTAESTLAQKPLNEPISPTSYRCTGRRKLEGIFLSSSHMACMTGKLPCVLNQDWWRGEY